MYIKKTHTRNYNEFVRINQWIINKCILYIYIYILSVYYDL